MAKQIEEVKGWAGDYAVYCAHDEIVSTEKLVPNPRNPYKHPAQQIALLTKIIAAQGWRAPITVSTRSGFIVRGHARLQAAELLGGVAPVDYQHYENEATEYADLIADNRLSELARFDVNLGKEILQDIDTGTLDMDLTGFDEMALEQLMAPILDPDKEWGGMPEFAQDDKTSFKKVLVHVHNQEALDEFIKITGIVLKGGPTQTMAWYPPEDRVTVKGIDYVDSGK